METIDLTTLYVEDATRVEEEELTVERWKQYAALQALPKQLTRQLALYGTAQLVTKDLYEHGGGFSLKIWECERMPNGFRLKITVSATLNAQGLARCKGEPRVENAPYTRFSILRTIFPFENLTEEQILQLDQIEEHLNGGNEKAHGLILPSDPESDEFAAEFGVKQFVKNVAAHELGFEGDSRITSRWLYGDKLLLEGWKAVVFSSRQMASGVVLRGKNAKATSGLSPKEIDQMFAEIYPGSSEGIVVGAPAAAAELPALVEEKEAF